MKKPDEKYCPHCGQELDKKQTPVDAVMELLQEMQSENEGDGDPDDEGEKPKS